MTPDERSRRLVDDHGLTRAPGDALKAYIASEIASAVYAEREACAKIADEIAAAPPRNDARHIDWQMGYQDGGMDIAAAIRTQNT